MIERQPVRRPGGRSARVRTAVHTAVTELLAEKALEEVTIAAVAERSGVHQTTLYRRWGTMSALVDDVVNEVLSRGSPVPDTGSLRGDLTAFAVKAAADLATPMGAVYLRAVAVGIGAPEDAQDGAHSGLLAREEQLQGMLDRATARGETAPTVLDLLEVVLAPMYFRLLMFRVPPDEQQARTLVDRLLRLAEPM
ncbi:TetR/AcrR family transcriptional regulator [Streptomyces sulphureus]|uniref:TetR/AcrR family transcriptional regulator n=1 Tax=Streptomyces sulphureus TaxID=47758 RepID=UPI0004774C6F|nr:TetR/AcrR family transcriptional regulator [Streptomyces sulphureus]